MSVLLSFWIGPVQEFIAAARKTRDLWYGSDLLSEVSRAAALELRKQGGRLIFPPDSMVDEKHSVANKLLARFEGDDPAVARDAAGKAATAACAVLDGRLEDLQHQIRPPGEWRYIDDDLLKRQVDGFLETAAAWEVYADEAGYAAARGAVERLLAGRKALRTFGPAELPRPDANGSIPIRLKSSLDPSRESVLIDETEPRLFGRRKRNEHLDGISLIKRMGDARRFVSTARVAVDPFIRRAQENSVAKPQLAQLRQLAQEMKNERNDAVEEFKADPASGLHHYAPFPFDTELFFDDDARRVLREISPDDPTMDQARKFIRLVGELTKAVGFPPTPYFVVLVADGDHMGRAIGKLTSIEGHIGFSEAVARFATEAEGIVAEHHGVVVYAGGDDVLAFLPVDSALDCAESLRTAFTREVATALPSEVERPTLSVGLSIGHYREPLDNLLTWGRAAERVAKEKGRNRLAVALHTASGGSDATVAHRSWDDDPVAKRWKKWTGWYAHDVLPDGFAYELRDLVRDLRAQPEELAARLLAPEAARILDRKWSAHGRVRVRDEEGGALRREMLDLIGSSLDAVEQSVDEMLIARRLVAAIGADRPRATDVAAATPAEGGSPS